MTIIHYDESSEFGKDMLDLIALLGWMMDEEQNMNKGAINSGLRIAQGKIQRIRDRIRKEKGIAYFEGDKDEVRTLRQYGRGLLRGDLRPDVQDARDGQAMLRLLPWVLHPLPRMAASRQGAGGLPMSSLNAKDAIVGIMSDGVGRTTPQLVDELLRIDRVWFRNICRTAVSCKCSDLVRDGVLIRAGLEFREGHAQPLIIWRLRPCPEERRSRRDR